MTEPARLGTGEADLATAVAHLRAGGLVAFPTETVYGLGADATNDRAVARIFEVKGRPSFNPLIVHVAGREMAEGFAEFGPHARALADAFWPGPLSLVVPRRDEAGAAPVSRLTSAGLATVAVRQPGHGVARALIEAAGCPIAAPSANPSGRLSPTRAADVELPPPPDGPLVIDGGACALGLESTVVEWTGAAVHILRPGPVTAADIAARTGLAVTDLDAKDPSAPKSPGQQTQHYAPATPLRIDATEVGADEALLAFGAAPLPGAAATVNLSETSDLVEAAANLFAMLHDLDRGGYRAIAVMPVPEDGLGAAINDRLRRAASG